MEGYIGEIRMFSGTFAPRGWMFCAGQQLSVSNYQALYTIIGTIYGGDGANTFNLPSLASRTAIGAGQGLGLTNYVLGQVTGYESVTLLQTQIPAHTHAPTIQTTVATPAATVTLNGSDTTAGNLTPAGSLYGLEGGNMYVYAKPATATPVAMAPNAVTVTSFSGPLPTITVGVAGSSLPHENIQPYTAINYVICIEGIFPSRN